MRKALIAGTVALAAATALLLPGQARAATRVVDDDKVQCPSATYTTIQAAVAAASPGDTIKVCPGNYTATNVDKPNLTLIGSTSALSTRQCLAGTGGMNPATDSIVTGSGPAAAFTVSANGITIRNFTVQGTSGNAGIHVAGTFSNATIRANLVQDNVFGIYLNGDQHRAESNCIRNNNQAGSAAGNGVYSDQGLQNSRIRSNVFTKHTNASIILVGSTHNNDQIVANLIIDDASIILTNLTNSRVSNNVSTRSNGSGIFFGGGSNNVSVDGNTIERCAFTGINVRSTLPYTVVPNTRLQIKNNGVSRCGDGGIRLRDGANNNSVSNNSVSRNGTGADHATGSDDGIALENADNNVVANNKSEKNTNDGLFADAASTNNKILNNKMSDHPSHDCHDDSAGGGTAGTANTWKGNQGNTENRPGLCKPGKDKDNGSKDDKSKDDGSKDDHS